MQKISIKREQSQAGLSFAEREKFRPQVKNKLLLLLALLMTAATGAWADDQSETIATATSKQVTYTGEHFTISGQFVDSEGLWIVQGQSVTIESKNGENITKIEALIGYSEAGIAIASEPSGDVTGTYSEGETITISSVNATKVTLSSSVSSLVMLQIKSWTIYYDAPAGYTVSLKDGVKDADKWTVKVGDGQAQALPIGGLKGDGSETVTLQYTGRLKVKGVKATSEAAPAEATYTLLSAATTADCGKVVCAAGHLHDAKTAVPDGCTAVGILGKVTETGHGLILALKDATSQTWNTIDGWTSVTTYAGTTLKVLPDDAARGTNLTSYTALGETAVSNWAVAQMSDYQAIFDNLGSTIYDKVYDDNVNAYITGAGGTAIDGSYLSATPFQTSEFVEFFYSVEWGYQFKTTSLKVRPVLGFGGEAAGPAAGKTVDLSSLSADYAAQNGDVLTGETTSKKVTIAAGATVTLDGVNISSGSYCIKCAGDATIILKDGSTNTLTGTSQDYPALWIGDANTTLTIQGSTGVLNVTSGQYCAGIGGGYSNTNKTCGNIRIEGGVITAQGGYNGAGIGSDSYEANCGDIIITGGTITAKGGTNAAGIGTGYGSGNPAVCGAITIANTVTKVTATKGDEYVPHSIGKGNGDKASCGTVTIGGTKYWENKAAVNGGDTYLATSPLIYDPSAPAKEPATVTTAPTGAAIVGVGKTTALVSGGAADGGTLMYAVTTTNTMPTSTDGFSDAVPTAEGITASGKVYVWYYVKADDTHSDSEIAATAIEVPVADVVWDATNISELEVYGTDEYEVDGVKLSGNADEVEAEWKNSTKPSKVGINFSANESGGFTFTAPTGKKFTKIEMIAQDSSVWDFSNLGTGWTLAGNDTNCTITWTGSAASAVKLLKDANPFGGAAPVIRIAFYLSE